MSDWESGGWERVIEGGTENRGGGWERKREILVPLGDTVNTSVRYPYKYSCEQTNQQINKRMNKQISAVSRVISEESFPKSHLRRVIFEAGGNVSRVRSLQATQFFFFFSSFFLKFKYGPQKAGLRVPGRPERIGSKCSLDGGGPRFRWSSPFTTAGVPVYPIPPPVIVLSVHGKTAGSLKG